MIRTHGVAGTRLRLLAREAEVTLGSTYHHIPGGKLELIEEAVRMVGDHVQGLIQSARGRGLEAALDAVVTQWRVVPEQSDFGTEVTQELRSWVEAHIGDAAPRPVSAL